ncbi:MAG: hypothetical protein R3D78_07915 [Paracoccaceae bacterium]
MNEAVTHIFLANAAMPRLCSAFARSLPANARIIARAGLGPVLEAPAQGGGVLVDHSLLGAPEEGWDSGFAEVGTRAEGLAAQLAGPVGRLVVPLASYEALYPALWRSLAAGRVMPAFDACAPALAARARGWVEILREIVLALRPAELILLPAPRDQAELGQALLPALALRQAPLRGAQLPDTALAMVQRLHGQGLRPPRRQMGRLLQFHARLPQPAPIAGFSGLDAARLRLRFEAELQRLARHPRVRIGAAQDPARLAAE